MKQSHDDGEITPWKSSGAAPLAGAAPKDGRGPGSPAPNRPYWVIDRTVPFKPALIFSATSSVCAAEDSFQVS